MSRADLAVAYAARQWNVFPLQVGLKQPIRGSRGFYAGTDDIVTVRGWWRQADWNIGIWTGGSNLVVMDLDVDKERTGALPGFSWWTDMCARVEYDWEQTYCVVTASGGLHVYFATEKLYPPAVGKFGALVDVRAGNSYVVAAGSETAVGTFEHCCGEEPLSLPDWLDALIEPMPVVRPSPLEQLAHDNRPDAYEKAVAGLMRVLQDAQEGERNNTFNWCCVKVGEHWWSEQQREDALDRLQVIGSLGGLTEREMADTMKSARRRWPAR